jgi:predicted dehydrogenase
MTGPDGNVRVAVLGAGYWAVVNHLPALRTHPDVEIVSICGRGAELQSVAAEFGVRIATSNADEALDTDLDAVVIATPNTLHYPMALNCLTRGLHVLVEKPIATNASQAWNLVSEAEEAHRIGLVAYGWNYAGFVEWARTAVLNGEIGDVQSFLCHMASPTLGLFNGRGGYGPAPAVGPSQPEAVTWAAVEHGGGYAFGQLTHALGLLFWITELDPSDIWARTSLSSHGVDLIDVAVMALANGAIGSVMGSGNLPEHAPYQVDLRLTGTRGSLVLDIAGGRCEVVRHDRPMRTHEIAPRDKIYDGQKPVKRFIELVRGEPTKNCSPLSCGARSVSVVDALLRSARTRQVERCVVEVT